MSSDLPKPALLKDKTTQSFMVTNKVGKKIAWIIISSLKSGGYQGYLICLPSLRFLPAKGHTGQSFSKEWKPGAILFSHKFSSNQLTVYGVSIIKTAWAKNRMIWNKETLDGAEDKGKLGVFQKPCLQAHLPQAQGFTGVNSPQGTAHTRGKRNQI